MSEKNPQIACVVMASGEGKRFGPQRGGKLLAPLGGMAVLERVLRALPAEEFCKIVVVTRWLEVEALCRRMEISCVRHDRPLRSDTIRAGLRAVIGGELEACLFVAGDQPLLAGESVRQMVQFWDKAYSEGRQAVVRLGWKQEAGNPVLFPKAMFDALCSLEGNRGGASLLRTVERKQGDASLERNKEPEVLIVEAGSPYELMDVDTPEALAKLAKIVLEKEKSDL